MTRKDLQTRFHIFGNNKDISIYNKERTEKGMGYRGNISLVRGKAVLNGKSYKTLDELDNALTEWEKTLEWPVDTYNPMLNDTWKLESRLIWFLEEKLGFKQEHSNWEVLYVRKIGDDYAIRFEISRDREDGVCVSSRIAGYHFMQKVENANDGVATITAIVRYGILQMAKDMVSALALLPETDAIDVDTYVKDNSNIFGWKKTDFKSVMIEMLEKQLEVLKK